MGLGRNQVLVVATLLLGALGYLMYTGMQDTMVFYYTVSEIMDAGPELSETQLRIAGKVVPGTIEVSNTDHLDRTFVIHEGGKEIPVEYRGIAPDTLVDDADAVVEGELGADGVFRATFVMAKCPSKYEAETDYSKYREAGVVATGQTRP
ncbi:MAG: cytochrome c maturation protein CcmE [Acidobacteria bacterium]|nr:cytochrome c maturation protein CcmE [Acidobacteriota bacterium]